MLADDDEHLGGGCVLEASPAEVFVGALAGVEAFGEDGAVERALEAQRLALLQRVQFVEPADEEEAGDLLDDLERV